MCTSFESLIPFAAGHELIRSRKQNLTLIGPISDILFDQMTGAGCVKKIRAAWVGNALIGSAYNFRRLIENRDIEIEDHSNFTMAMALKAGAMGVTYMPAYTALGSDLYKTNPNLKKITCPFTGEKLTAIKAINPDVAIVHVQRADKYGNAHIWGNLGITKDACLASRHIILTCEEIVSYDMISKDPNRIIIPGFRVSAVVHAPWGGHPSSVPGFYNRDNQFFIEYSKQSKTPEAFANWQNRWIDPVRASNDYLDLLGKKRIAGLELKNHLLTEPVDYGY